MGLYLLKRLFLAIPALWAFGTAVFLLSRLLPGSYGSERLLSSEGSFYSKGSVSDRQAAFHTYLKRTGQDLPLFYITVQPSTRQSSDSIPTGGLTPQGYSFHWLMPQVVWHGTANQYHRWLWGMVQGEWGTSLKNTRPVLPLLYESVGNTLWLLLCSMLITLTLAYLLSVRMIQRKKRWLRKTLLPGLFAVDSIPPFVLALLLLTFLANPDFLQLFPVYGMGYYTPDDMSAWQRFTEWWYYMALPLLCLVLFNLPYLTSQLHQALEQAMQADYIRTARAKGLPEAVVIRHHAVRNALLPIITVLTDFLPALVTGTFIVESIFAIPGIGRLLIDSVLSRDYPVLTAIVLLIVLFRMIAYILADVAYAWADPRIKTQVA